ncbi:Na-translocating system protein MpsC family protein [Clostridiaceae bacterium 35-E11]
MDKKIKEQRSVWMKKNLGKRQRAAIEKKMTYFMTKSIKEITGKGPEVIKSKIDKNKIYIHLEGFLTPLEQSILNQDFDLYHDLIKKLRESFVNTNKQFFLEGIGEIIGHPVELTHLNNDLKNDKGIITFDIQQNK